MRRVLRRVRPLRPLAALLAMAVVAVGCATNPVTGQRQFTLISERQEIGMGRDYDPQIVAELGLYPDSALQAYVQELGARMAAGSERPHLPWTFRVLDDPLVNAFALPGGFIYVTRGIIAHFGSEAELAAVLGHEIGHVTARHSVVRMSTQQLAQIGLVVGTVLRPELEGVAGAASAGLGILFLKHSRDDERQSDELGLRYMLDAGYDPREMPRVFSMLEAVSRAEGAGRAPEWLATHPSPENRRERMEEQVAALGIDLSDRRVGREDYLRRLDGMIYGENPREGFFRQQRFFHPELKFQLAFPEGWATRNTKQAVAAVSPASDAIVHLELAREASPDAALRAFVAQEGIRTGATSRSDINGLPAAVADFAANTAQGGTLRGRVAFISHGDSVYRLLGYSAEGRWGSYESVVWRAFRSFDRLTDAADLAVQPLRLEIVTLRRPMTLTEFVREYPSALSVERLALLNGVTDDARLEAGTPVKRVVGEPVR